MSVLLSTSVRLPAASAFATWCAVAPACPDLPQATQRPGFAAELEGALEDIFPEWLAVGKSLSAHDGGALVHATSGGHNASDLGLTMAWLHLARRWAGETPVTLIVCDDPWVYRALAGLDGVDAGPPPPLLRQQARLALRGIAARTVATIRTARAWLGLRSTAANFPSHRAALLVYGHPASAPDGTDAYFGTLMREKPDLVRLLHTDCPQARARYLAADGRTWSLHAFGSMAALLRMPFVRWHPTGVPAGLSWLIRRAAAMENSRASAAMTYWQTICQRRWLGLAAPQAVAWPWENHNWERAFAREARACGTRTIGYQHASFGWQERNHAAASNPDGTNSLPDRVICAGAAWRARLIRLGIPDGLLAIGGAWRYPAAPVVSRDPEGPVFVALPAHHTIASQLLDALRPLAAAGRRFLVKSHPLTPISFTPAPGLSATDRPLGEQSAISAVVFASSTVGLEARLAGLPVVRFLPTGLVGSNVLPDDWTVPTADATGLSGVLDSAVPAPVPTVDNAEVFAPVERALWHAVLALDTPLPPLGPPMAGGRLTALRRKAAQVGSDPVLRRWLAGRLLGRYGGEPAYRAHRPPYLDAVAAGPAPVPREFVPCRSAVPTGAQTLRLPGRIFDIYPGDERWLFSVPLGDSETWLALHRFAWLPLSGDTVDPAWAVCLYRAWKERFAGARGGWAWHPYTAVERAVNLLAFAKDHGTPEAVDAFQDTLRAHAEEIAGRLEYFGDHHTGNHLANNGRGLYLIGLALGDGTIAARGRAVLLAEAERIFSGGGVLREGSSHYHLLVTRWYAEVWLAARQHESAEAPAFEALVRRALAAAPSLFLPGGMPLVGDISPDAPPGFLFADGRFGGAWFARLTADEQAAIAVLMTQTGTDLSADGWYRFAAHDWAGLWHAAPGGWSAMPGHGHQDVGGFELHWRNVAVFIDPGRGGYGDDGETARYRAAEVHSTLTVDGADPYPPNRPYYDDAFRRTVVGTQPAWTVEGKTVQLTHDGYTRLNGTGRVTRQWTFSENGFALTDTIAGQGRHTVRRRFVTPHPVKMIDGRAVISAPGATFHVHGAHLAVLPIRRWTAYGEGADAWAVDATCETALPFADTIRVDVTEEGS